MEVEKSSAASVASCERLRWISQQGGKECLFNRLLEMLKLNLPRFSPPVSRISINVP